MTEHLDAVKPVTLRSSREIAEPNGRLSPNRPGITSICDAQPPSSDM